MSHVNESRIINACDLARSLHAMYGPGKSRSDVVERLVSGVLLLERCAASSVGLIDALRRIADSVVECGCDHTTDDCCSRVGVFCTRCIAAVAIQKAEQ